MSRTAKTVQGNPDRYFRRSLYIVSLLIVPLIAVTQNVQYVSPVPGASNVSQESNVIIKTKGLLDGSAALDVSYLSVEGAKSGQHPGQLVLSDDGKTLVFQPFRPFDPGEEVSVRTRSGARTLDGARIEPLNFKFTVTSLSSSEQHAILGIMDISDFPNNLVPQPPIAIHAGSLKKTNSDTVPDGFPTPQLIESNNPSQGSVFLSTFKMGDVGGSIQLVPSNEQFLMILDNKGNPIFYRKMPAISTDFKLQTNGYLTYYDGSTQAFYALDSIYTVVDSFKCGNGYTTDDHELLILPNGHSLLLGLEPIVMDMSTVVPGGSTRATVIGMVIQELDQARNVVFQWRTFDHFQITDATYENLQASTIDYVHSNAIDVDTDGNLLLSSRHLDEITKIDRQTGAIIWRLGGKNNQFKFVNDTVGFSHQHSIRRTPSGTLILFDDGNFHVPQFSRAVEYSMDEQAKTVTQIWQFRHSPEVYAFAMGSVQRLANGNTVIGWGMGFNAAVTEVRPDGSVASDLRLPDSVVSYRAFLLPWNPTPLVTSVQSATGIPGSFSLSQNYPNPFNPSTMIQFTVPRQSNVSLKVYDVVGREVARVVEGIKPAGAYSVQFDASRLASGVYFYRLAAPGWGVTKTMTLIK